MPVDLGFLHENQITKNVGLETSHSILRETAQPLSQLTLCHPQLVLAGNWALIQPICSASLWLLFLSFILEEIIPLKNTNNKEVGQDARQQLQQAWQWGTVAWGREGLLRWEASYSSGSPSPTKEATTRRAVLACGGGIKRAFYQR